MKLVRNLFWERSEQNFISIGANASKVRGRSLNLRESKVRIIVELARKISERAREPERYAHGLVNASR